MHRFSVGRGVATPCWVGQRQKLSTTSFLTLAAAARSQRAALKWMRPKGCQKQEKAMSSLYHVFKHIQLSPATAIFFLSMNVMHEHQFLFISDRVVRSCKSSDSVSIWAIRCDCGRWWLQKRGTCRCLNRYTGKAHMLHVGLFNEIVNVRGCSITWWSLFNDIVNSAACICMTCKCIDFPSKSDDYDCEHDARQSCGKRRQGLFLPPLGTCKCIDFTSKSDDYDC